MYSISRLYPSRTTAAISAQSTGTSSYSEPTALTDVRRHEEAVGSGSDEYLLGAGRRRAPEGHPIIVVTVREGGELPPADVPGRLAVAEALTDVRVGQAQLAQLRHGTHQPARWCSAIRSRITWSYSGK